MTATYEEEMRRGAAEYSDVLAGLAAAGYNAEFTQTGGMCFAIQVHLNSASYALITDKEEILAPTRDGHRGWSIGIYDLQDPSDPIRFESTDDGTLAGLLTLAATVFDGGRAR